MRCRMLSSQARVVRSLPLSGRPIRSGTLLMNSPTVFCICGMCAGRPDTVTPNTMSRERLWWCRLSAQAAWTKVFRVRRWRLAVSCSSWVSSGVSQV
ncbi:hypothetical protein D3C80_1364770 [compost metagenome]